MTSTPVALSPNSIGRRIGYAALGLAAVIATVLVARTGHGWAVSVAWIFALAPDLPLLAGMRGGRLNPRAVPAYNATHRLVGPLVTLGAAAVAAVTSAGGRGLSATLAAAGLAWLAHVLIDRACGYGLRNRQGWQRDR